MKCNSCDLVFLESFDHINESYYEESKMFTEDNDTVEEIHLEENEIDNNRRALFVKKYLPEGKSILDFGCGNGGFLNKIESYCLYAHGVEKDINHFNKFKHNENIKIYSSLEKLETKYDMITLFHVLEHIKDPIEILEKLKLHLNPGGKIIIEVPNSKDVLLELYESKKFSKFTYWSPHLYLFNNKNLKTLLRKVSLNVDEIIQVQRYPLANHIYWLAKGKPGGHNVWNFLKDEELDSRYEKKLKEKEMCDTIIAITHKE